MRFMSQDQAGTVSDRGSHKKSSWFSDTKSNNVDDYFFTTVSESKQHPDTNSMRMRKLGAVQGHSDEGASLSFYHPLE
jgi:hypothetical protein